MLQRKTLIILGTISLGLSALLLIGYSQGFAVTPTSNSGHPVHRGITVTTFWVGEDASSENAYIPNSASAWDDHWLDHFGGIDAPDNRDAFRPADFAPKENPFYFALPYNDFQHGDRKGNAATVIPWAKNRQWAAEESMCKNRWIKITHDNKVAYAQWEDVGPFETNDANYVFGTTRPHSRTNAAAGLDVSPAVQDYLGLDGRDTVDWQFVDAAAIPDGPWKQVVTTSQIDWGE